MLRGRVAVHSSPSDDIGKESFACVVKDSKALFCSRDVTIQPSIQRLGTSADQGSMDVQKTDLDDEGE